MKFKVGDIVEVEDEHGNKKRGVVEAIENTYGFKIGDRVLASVAGGPRRKGTITNQQWEQRDGYWFFDVSLDDGCGVLNRADRLKRLDAVERLGDLA